MNTTPAEDQPQVEREKSEDEQIEDARDSPLSQTPPGEWEEEKPKLNLQMALAFLVSPQAEEDGTGRNSRKTRL